jgi:membrane dipeptidase
MEQVWEAMKKQGITERQMDKIWSENALRVLREVL